MSQRGCRGETNQEAVWAAEGRKGECVPGRGHSTAAEPGRKERARHLGGIQMGLWPEHREGWGGAEKEEGPCPEEAGSGMGQPPSCFIFV